MKVIKRILRSLEARNSPLHIDPFRIKRYVEIREIDYRLVDVINGSILAYSYSEINPNKGRIIEGEIEIMNSEHTPRTVIILIVNDGLPEDYTVPMIELEFDMSPATNASFLLDTVKVSIPNEIVSKRENMTLSSNPHLT